MLKTDAQKDLSYLLARAHRLLNAKLETLLESEGLSVEQWRVLEALNEQDGCSMGELAERVLMNHPALTKLADRMVANGLIHRVADQSDLRRVLVHNTERGTVFYRRAERKVAGHNAELERTIGASKAAALRALLEDLSLQELESERR